VTGLTRAIRLPHATAMVVGTIIGASIFVQPAEVTGRVPSLSGALLVWLVAGILTFFGAIVTAELAAIKPDSGGVYVFLREAFSPLLGFLWGWAMFWTMHSGIIAAISVVFARYLSWFFPVGDTGIRLIAVGSILGISWLNYLGVRQGSLVQTVMTTIKVGAVLLMVGIGIALGTSFDPAATAIGSRAAASTGLLGGSSITDFLLALVAGLFAFGGWHMVTYAAGETVDPRKTIPRSLMLGIAIVTGAYLLLNLTYFYILPLDTVMSSDRIAADAADAVLGSGGGAVMSGLVAFSTLGGLIGIILCGPRVYHAMALDGLLFRWVAVLHPTRRTPHRAILLQAIWASALVWTESYRALFTRVIYTEWIFFGLMAIGLLILRRRLQAERETETAPVPVSRLIARWAWPWVPIVFAVCAFSIAINQIVADPANSLIGLGLVLLGIPAYAIATRGASPSG
jgi:APA family basic amino acid/polyamine antiporter